MRRLDTLTSDDNSSPKRNLDVLSFLHRITCIYGILITVFCLFQCYLSVANALQDVHKFEHTGTFSYFLHFLDEYNFAEDLLMCLSIATELLLYIVQYNRVQKAKPFTGSIWYFTVMMIIHVIIWIHANSISLPKLPPYNVADEAGLYYRASANLTVIPSVIYFIQYLLCIRKCRTKQD